VPVQRAAQSPAPQLASDQAPGSARRDASGSEQAAAGPPGTANPIGRAIAPRASISSRNQWTSTLALVRLVRRHRIEGSKELSDRLSHSLIMRA
jgi:hypothetical protein